MAPSKTSVAILPGLTSKLRRYHPDAHVWQTAGATGFQRGMRLSILYDLYSLEIVAHVKRLVDSPVVWHTDTLPPCRTVGFQIDICYIAAMKFPPFSKRNHLPGC